MEIGIKKLEKEKIEEESKKQTEKEIEVEEQPDRHIALPESADAYPQQHN